MPKPILLSTLFAFLLLSCGAPAESLSFSSSSEVVSSFVTPVKEAIFPVAVLKIGNASYQGEDAYFRVDGKEDLDAYNEKQNSSSKVDALNAFVNRLDGDYFNKHSLLLSKEIELNYPSDSLSFSYFDYAGSELTVYYDYAVGEGNSPAVLTYALAIFGVTKEVKITNFNVVVRR